MICYRNNPRLLNGNDIMALDPKELQKSAEEYARAWSSKSPQAVASFFAEDGQIVINRGDPTIGQAALVEMVAGFYAEFPDLIVHCDELRTSGDHGLFAWTLEGHHVETKNFVKIKGWEEWDYDAHMKIKSSRGWFDADEYDRQIAEGF